MKSFTKNLLGKNILFMIFKSSRGESQLTFRPLTPPYVRTHIRRFNKLSVRTGTSRRCPHILGGPVLCLLMIDEEYDFLEIDQIPFLVFDHSYAFALSIPKRIRFFLLVLGFFHCFQIYCLILRFNQPFNSS